MFWFHKLESQGLVLSLDLNFRLRIKGLGLRLHFQKMLSSHEEMSTLLRMKEEWSLSGQNVHGLLASVAAQVLALCKHNFRASRFNSFSIFKRGNKQWAKLQPFLFYRVCNMLKINLQFFLHCFMFVSVPLVSSSSCHHLSNSTKFHLVHKLLTPFSSFLKKTLEIHPALTMEIKARPAPKPFSSKDRSR